MPIWRESHWVGLVENEDFVSCLICGYKSQKLEYHLKNTHHMSVVDYRFKYGRYVLVQSKNITQQRKEVQDRRVFNAREQENFLRCPVCSVPLKNSKGLTNHVQRHIKKGEIKHIEWQKNQDNSGNNGDEKVCSLCKKTKPKESFSKSPSCRDGRRGQCVQCLAEKAKISNPTRIWSSQASYKTLPGSVERKRDAQLRKDYGIGLSDYADILKSQNWVCAICGAPDNGLTPKGNPANFHVDHDHNTGIVRGILCFPCNKGIGMFRDNPNNLKRAAEYLCKTQSDLTNSQNAKTPLEPDPDDPDVSKDNSDFWDSFGS